MLLESRSHPCAAAGWPPALGQARVEHRIVVLKILKDDRIDPPYRLWIWKDDLAEAREKLMVRGPCSPSLGLFVPNPEKASLS